MTEPLFRFGSQYRLDLKAPYRTCFVQQFHGTELQFAHTDCQLVIDFFEEKLAILKATQQQEVDLAIKAMSPVTKHSATPATKHSVIQQNQVDSTKLVTPSTMEVGLAIQWMIDNPNQHLLDSNGDWWMYNPDSRLFFTASKGTDFESKSIVNAIESSLSFTISDFNSNDINKVVMTANLQEEEKVPDTLRPLHQSIPHLESNNSNNQLENFPTTGQINQHSPLNLDDIPVQQVKVVKETE
jgi:hypothetical protein